MNSRLHEHRPARLQILAFLLAAVPAAYALLLVFSSARACTDDYWGILSPLLDQNGEFIWRARSWLFPHNRYHCIPLTRVVYAANVYLTHGSNHGLSLFAWVMCLWRAGVLLMLARLMLPTSLRPLHLVLVSAFCFTPAAAWMWFHAFGGAHWMAADALGFSSIASLAQIKRYGWSAVIGAIVAGLLAMGFFSTAVGIWPALVLAAFLLPLTRGQRATIVAASCAVIVSYGFWIMSFPVFEVTEERAGVFSMFLFVLTFIGCLFTTKIEIAALLGLIGIALSIWFAVHCARNRRDRTSMTPWLALLLYALCNAGMAAMGRSQFGVESAVSSRYAHLPAVFWLGLLILAIHVASSWPTWGRSATRAVVAIGGVLVLAMSFRGFSYVRPMLEQARLQRAAELSMQMGIFDPIAFRDTLSGCVDITNPVWIESKRIGHIPFDREVQLPVSERGTVGKAAFELTRIRGEMPRLQRSARPRFIRAMGWFELESGTVEEIETLVLADERGVIRGMAVVLDDPLRLPFLGRRRAEWIGYSADRPANEQLAVFFRLKGQEGYTRAGPYVAVRSGNDEFPFDQILTKGKVSIAGEFMTDILR